MEDRPSIGQQGYIMDLLHYSKVSRLSIGDITTRADAQRAITYLLSKTPLRQKTRSAVFAALAKSKAWDKERLYESLGVESITEGSDATEADGRKALDLILGQVKRYPAPIVDRVYPTPSEPAFVDGLVEMEAEQLAAWAASQPSGDHIVEPDQQPIASAAPVRRGRPGVAPRQPVVVPVVAPVRRPGRPEVAPRSMEGMNPLVRAVLEQFPGSVVIGEKRLA